MATNFQQINHLCLLFWLIIFVTRQSLTSALSVNVKRTTARYNGHSMPDTLHVTLAGESGTPIDLNLQRVEYAEPNVPVYTLQVDETGRGYAKNEELEDNKNIAYYHDLKRQAAMQVTRVGNKGVQYELKGSVTVDGKVFSLEQEKGSTRESHVSSENEVTYSLIQLEPTKVVFDYVKRNHQESHYSSAETVDSRQSATQIFIDIVAIADHSSYKSFRKAQGNRQSTIKAMQRYYSDIFNKVDSIYQRIRGQRYTFSVRLARLIICETASLCSFIENYVNYYSFNGDYVLASLKDFVLNDKHGVINPYDHVMVFTKYDMVLNSMDIAGYAPVGAICQKVGRSTSLVEDRQQSITHLLAAHELGHGLGAEHDGDGNRCDAKQFLMGAVLGSSNVASTFSQCSLVYFVNTIYGLLRSYDLRECLTGKLPINNTLVIGRRSRNLWQKLQDLQNDAKSLKSPQRFGQ